MIMRSDNIPNFYETYEEGRQRIEKRCACVRRYIVRGSVFSIAFGVVALYSASHFRSLEDSVLEAAQESAASSLFKLLGSVGLAVGVAGLGLGYHLLTEWREHSYERLEQDTYPSHTDLRRASLSKNRHRKT